MRSLHLLAALAVSSLAVIAQGAPQDSPAAKESSASSDPVCRGGVGANCTTDANCGGNLVCDAHCPVIAGRPHCEIAGGVCEPRCKETSKDLSGKSFTSLDGTHSILFDSSSTYRKTDGCPNTGIHCDHIAVSTGTFHANGAKVSLTSNQGAEDTLKVEPHCYDGLLDSSDHVELYPAN